MIDTLLPGATYRELLARFHETLRPESYLEIGVRCGDSLRLARPGTPTVAIDPRPQIEHPIDARVRLYPISSDGFFRQYELLAELGTPRLGLAFIDGLHTFEQVLRDFFQSSGMPTGTPSC